MDSAGSSGRASSGPRSFDFGSDDVLCSYDDFLTQDPSNGRRSDPSPKDSHESRVGRPLVSAYGQPDEYPKEEIIAVVEKCMKKYADNLLRHLEGICGRLSQLEIYCYKLERSIGEFRADMIRDQGETDTKLNSLEKHLQEVHRSIQILRDRQELAETHNELAKLQLAPKEPTTTTQSQKSEEPVAPSSVPEPNRHDKLPEIPNPHLALALPHQIPPPTSLPHSVTFYSQQNQALQPELQYIQVQPRPQIQEHPIQASPQQQPSQLVNQPQPPQPFPQQQWSHQPPAQQFNQQVVASAQQPPSQVVLVRPRTPPTHPSYTHQSMNPETFAYSTVPQSNTVNAPIQPQHQANSQSSFSLAPAKVGAYASMSPYPMQSNVQGYSMIYSSPHPSNVPGFQNQQLPPSNSSGFYQLVRNHPYADVTEKAVSMGYSREQVAGAVNMMVEIGQPVDLNPLLETLNTRAASGGPPRGWSG